MLVALFSRVHAAYDRIQRLRGFPVEFLKIYELWTFVLRELPSEGFSTVSGRGAPPSQPWLSTPR